MAGSKWIVAALFLLVGATTVAAARTPAAVGWPDVERAVAILNAKAPLHPRLASLAKRRPVRCGIAASADWPDHVVITVLSAQGPWTQYFVGPEGENPGMRRGGENYAAALAGQSLGVFFSRQLPCTLGGDGRLSIDRRFVARTSDLVDKQNVRSIIPAIESYYADHATYGGMTLAHLRTTYDLSLDAARYLLVVTHRGRSYCVQSPRSGTRIWKKAGPAASIVAGRC